MTLDEELLVAMIEACKRGLVTWVTTEANYLWTSSEGWTLGLHLIERGDGESFRDVIEVCAGAVSAHYYRGTLGYQLASQLLRLAEPSFAEHNALIEKRISSELIRIRTSLLQD